MSKITKALEKAARERLQQLQEKPTVTAKAATIPLELLNLAQIAPAGSAQVDPHIVSASDSKSPIAEQYRILRTNLQSLRLPAATRAAQAGMRPGAKVVVVTSAVHGEGKSVTTVNLALTLARQENLKVVLIDGDLRKSSIDKWLGLPQREEGLSTVLQRGGELNGSLIRLQDPSLAILPAGPTPDHPTELLESSSMRRLLATLKTQFDVILIDSPPVLPVADPAILGAQADGVILVVRAGKTQRKTVQHTQALLSQVKANILGCVLTHVEYYMPGYYRYYHYYRYGAKKDSDKQQATSNKQGVAEGAVA